METNASANGNELHAGIYWDIENIPIHAYNADEEAKDAVVGMNKLAQTNHFNDSNFAELIKIIKKFVIVARKDGDYISTPQISKDRVVAHGVSILMQRKRKRSVENKPTVPVVELIDLPFSRAKDYCDKEIIRRANIYVQSYQNGQKVVIYLMTGDKDIIRQVNAFSAQFDLVIVILRGNRELRNVTGHCRNVRRENAGRGRRIQIYMFEEVVRAGKSHENDFPVNDVEIFAREGVHDIDPFANANANSRNRNAVNRIETRNRNTAQELDDAGHFDILFPQM